MHFFLHTQFAPKAIEKVSLPSPPGVLYIYLFGLCWFFLDAQTTLWLWGTGFSLHWLLLLWSTDSRVHRLQELQLTGTRAPAQQLWLSGLVTLRHVGSSPSGDQTHISMSSWSSWNIRNLCICLGVLGHFLGTCLRWRSINKIKIISKVCIIHYLLVCPG